MSKFFEVQSHNTTVVIAPIENAIKGIIKLCYISQSIQKTVRTRGRYYQYIGDGGRL